MSVGPVRTRCVFFLGGYEPIPPERQRERYIRELNRSAGVWAMKNVCTPPRA